VTEAEPGLTTAAVVDEVLFAAASERLDVGQAPASRCSEGRLVAE
jgi:hypothetical protein